MAHVHVWRHAVPALKFTLVTAQHRNQTNLQIVNHQKNGLTRKNAFYSIDCNVIIDEFLDETFFDCFHFQVVTERRYCKHRIRTQYAIAKCYHSVWFFIFDASSIVAFFCWIFCTIRAFEGNSINDIVV